MTQPRMPRPMRLGFAILCLCLFDADFLQAQQKAPPNDAEMQKLLEPIRAKADLPALAAAVVTSQGPKAIAVVGVRKRGSDVAVTTADLFHIGSDTKALTATLVARLIEEGKLDWDTPLAKVFKHLAKEMPPEMGRITIAQLLCHHGGLPEHLPDWWKVPRELSIVKQREWAFRDAFKLELDKAGDRFRYSAVGYVILGAACEKAGGASWEDLLKKKVLGPLDMRSAGFGPVGAKGKLDQPRAHNDKGQPVEPALSADNPPVMGPAGRLHCSLSDWSKFIADLLRGYRAAHAKAPDDEKTLLKADTYKKMFEAPYTKNYTLGGWLYQKTKLGYTLSHNGSNTLNFAMAFVAPEHDMGFLIVTNQGNLALAKVCRQARDTLLKHYLPGK